MTKYLLKRILHGIISVVIVVAIVMFMVYTAMDRTLIFATDPLYTKQMNNQKESYKYRRWKEFGYLDYVPYSDYLLELQRNGEIDEKTRVEAAKLGRTEDKDNATAKKYIAQFKEKYEIGSGYKFVRLDTVMQGKKIGQGGQAQCFVYKETPLISRLFNYFGNLVQIDNINRAEEVKGERKLTFTLYDPLYGGEKFSPAIIGNGTEHKYLLYFDNKFPYIHQNLITINLGTSYSVKQGQDVFITMTQSQGSYIKSTLTYPATGYVEESADDLHTATYVKGSLDISASNQVRFDDDYTSVLTVNSGMSKLGYSFVIGILEVILSYFLGVPLGIIMARKKDKLIDKLGTLYIVFIIAVPSLAYIFMFKAIGGQLGLPTTFNMDSKNKLMYVLPIISLALPAIASLMKWLRRYMIDQMNSDYVKFARSGGLSDSEIFSKHILKNAIIPLVHDIPASILFAMTGAIITERVYVVPSAGNLLTEAINKYDNGVIIGVTLFYALLSVTAVIVGDVLMSLVDPRISFSSKAR